MFIYSDFTNVSKHSDHLLSSFLFLMFICFLIELKVTANLTAVLSFKHMVCNLKKQKSGEWDTPVSLTETDLWDGLLITQTLNKLQWTLQQGNNPGSWGHWSFNLKQLIYFSAMKHYSLPEDQQYFRLKVLALLEYILLLYLTYQ